MAAPKLPYPDRAEPNALLSWGRTLVQALTRELNVAIGGTPGDMKVVAATEAPTGWIIPTGQVLDRAAYSSLFRAIGTSYNTGGESGAQFRLPNPANPFTGGRWIIKL